MLATSAATSLDDPTSLIDRTMETCVGQQPKYGVGDFADRDRATKYQRPITGRCVSSCVREQDHAWVSEPSAHSPKHAGVHVVAQRVLIDQKKANRSAP